MGPKGKGRETGGGGGWSPFWDTCVPNLFPREKLRFGFLELQWVAQYYLFV
jgi:hypothetical protein